MGGSRPRLPRLSALSGCPITAPLSLSSRPKTFYQQNCKRRVLTVVLRTAQAWLLSESLLSELARLHTEFIPTVEGLALERGALRDHLWSNLEHIAAPTMKEFVAQACKEPPLRNAYPIFSLNTLALNRTASMSTTGKIASVRCVEGRGYEVADSRGHSVGLGDAQWAITTLSNLVSESLKADG
jgi:hypothetical protein